MLTLYEMTAHTTKKQSYQKAFTGGRVVTRNEAGMREGNCGHEQY